MATESIKIINAALDEWNGDILLRGVVDPSSLAHLKVDDYQREILPQSRIKELARAIKSGKVPDIELGMRGGSFLEREGSFYLQDSVWIIDGLQRRTAAMELIRAGVLPRLGATIHFNTTKEWEREQFRNLNVSRVKLSPNVLVRNERGKSQGVEMLYRLCNDSTFVLNNRVSWDQRMKREHLIGGLALLKISSQQHRRFGTGLSDNGFSFLIDGYQRLYDRVGRNVLRENTKRFWEILDEAFNVRGVAYVVTAPHLKVGFLKTMARVFSDHKDFWADCNFVCNTDLRKKLATFPLMDPHIASLCASAGSSMRILYEMIVTHLNSGKRSRRLSRFDDVEIHEEGQEEVVA
jgi:hypothetical protein